MGEWVIDTNIWVVADGGHRSASPECEDGCLAWLITLRRSADGIVVDDAYEILREYRRNLRPGDYVEELLNTLERQRPRRLRWVTLLWGANGSAVVPTRLHCLDPSRTVSSLPRRLPGPLTRPS